MKSHTTYSVHRKQVHTQEKGFVVWEEGQQMINGQLTSEVENRLNEVLSKSKEKTSEKQNKEIIESVDDNEKEFLITVSRLQENGQPADNRTIASHSCLSLNESKELIKEMYRKCYAGPENGPNAGKVPKGVIADIKLNKKGMQLGRLLRKAEDPSGPTYNINTGGGPYVAQASDSNVTGNIPGHNITVGDASSINIDVRAMGERIIKEIEESDAPDREKREAKGLIKKALEHPLVVSTWGAVLAAAGAASVAYFNSK